VIGVSDHPEALICLSSPPGQTRGFSRRVYPVTTGSWRRPVAFGCIDAISAQLINKAVLPGQEPYGKVSGGCGIRTHGAGATDSAVFKTDVPRTTPAPVGSPRLIPAGRARIAGSALISSARPVLAGCVRRACVGRAAPQPHKAARPRERNSAAGPDQEWSPDLVDQLTAALKPTLPAQIRPTDQPAT